MNTATMIQTNEQTAVAEYADRIKKQLAASTTAWRMIADILAAASEEFGMDSDMMRSLLKQTKFSMSKASKLISIAKSARLNANANLFSSVDAWTVLYSVTQLTDDEFTQLIESIDEGDVITASTVSSARIKEDQEADPYKTVFSIQIDVNALKATLFSDAEYLELMEAMQRIQDTMDYVRVLKTPKYENEAARFQADVDREMSKLTRKLFAEAKKAYQRGENGKLSEAAAASIKVLMEKKQYHDAFAAIESDAFDQAELWSKAKRSVQNKREVKFTEIARPYDAYANTTIQQAA